MCYLDGQVSHKARCDAHVLELLLCEQLRLAAPLAGWVRSNHTDLDLTPLSSIYSRLADTSAKKSDNWRILVGVEW
jgi:hypothetical protein